LDKTEILPPMLQPRGYLSFHSSRFFTIFRKSYLAISYLEGSCRIAEGWYTAVNAQLFRKVQAPCCLVIFSNWVFCG